MTNFSHDELTSAELLNLIRELDEELGEREELVKLLVVGGAAVAFKWGFNRTFDVDVANVSLPGDLIGAVRSVGRANGIDPEWLNNHSRGFIARFEADPVPTYTGQAIEMYVATDRCLLDCKIQAARPPDYDDAVRLAISLDYDRSDYWDLAHTAESLSMTSELDIGIRIFIMEVLRAAEFLRGTGITSDKLSHVADLGLGALAVSKTPLTDEEWEVVSGPLDRGLGLHTSE